MIDGTDLLSLETAARDHLGEPSEKLWTRESIFRAINEEMGFLFRKIVNLDSGYFETVVTPTPAASYELPSKAYLIRNVQLYVGGVWVNPTWIGDHGRGEYQSYGSTSTWPHAVRFQDNTLYFEDGYGDATSMRVNYVRDIAKLVYATLSSGSTTTAVLPAASASKVDDAYIGDQFLITGGTGEGQISTISDYVASTRTCTIATGATLDNTTVVSWLLPEPLRKYPDVVARGAAIRLLERRRDTESIQGLLMQQARDVQDMMDVLSQRQTQQAARGNFLQDWGDE